MPSDDKGPLSPDPGPSPLLSPDGQSYWDGTRWLPVPGQAANSNASSRAQNVDKRHGRSWLGLGLTVLGGLLGVVLMSQPMILIGPLDIGLPLILAVAGMVLVRRENGFLKWSAWIIGALVVLLMVLAVIALASSETPGGGGMDLGLGGQQVMAPRDFVVR